MAGTVIPDVAKPKFLNPIIAGPLTGAMARLYTNAYTPDHTTTLADLTEGTWTGYAAQLLSGWSTPALDGTFHEYTRASPVAIPNSSGASQTVEGYFYTDASGDLLGVQRFTTPFTIPDGIFFMFRVVHTYTSEF